MAAARARNDDLDEGALGAALTLLGLGAFAVAQPLFDVLADHVAFLIAHRLDRFDLLLLAPALCGVPGLAALGIQRAARLGSRALGRAVLIAFVALGVAATALPPLQRSLAAPGSLLVAISLGLGAAAAAAWLRFAAVRSFGRLLSLGALGFPLWFVAATPASRLLAPTDGSDLQPAPVARATPVVLVVFDQFPLFTLLDEDEQIDAVRHPAFGALAATSEWYRNATTVSPETVYAVPAILTGRYPDLPRLPTWRDHPQNLFTLLGKGWTQHLAQTLTDLCPPAICPETAVPEPRSDRLRSVLRDLGYVYLHVLLPVDLRAGLPDVGSTWRDFEQIEWVSPDATADDPHGSWGDPSHVFARFIASIEARNQDGAPADEHVLLFLHINVPHVPWMYLPSGTVYGPVGRQLYPYPMNGMTDIAPGDGPALERALQRHLLQVGYADTLLGRLRARLEASGLWDDALVIVVADHGITFWPGTTLAGGDQRRISDVLHVPLFVKRPGAHSGSVSDENVETIDILPTIADVLGIELPERVDGKPLGSASPSERDTKQVFLEASDGTLQRVEFGRTLPGRKLSVHRMRRVFGDGEDWLFELGEHRDWIGRSPDELPRAPAAARFRVALEREADFADVPAAATWLPANVSGELRSEDGGPAPEQVAIALNGRVVAVAPTFATASGAAGFSALAPESAFRPGRNTVEVFAVEGRGPLARLAPTRTLSGRVFELAEAAQTLPSGSPASAVLRSPDGDLPVVPGALVGQVNVRGAILAGWARDPTHAALPEAVVIFENGRFYEQRDLAGARASEAVQAHVRDADQKTLVFDLVIPFERLRESPHPELRVFAIGGGVASELEYAPGFPYRRSVTE